MKGEISSRERQKQVLPQKKDPTSQNQNVVMVLFCAILSDFVSVGGEEDFLHTFWSFPLDKPKIIVILLQALYRNQVDIGQHIAATRVVNSGSAEVRRLRAMSLITLLLILGNLLVLGLFIIA